MSWIFFLWTVYIHYPVYGNRQISFNAKMIQNSNFSIDLIAESSDTADDRNRQKIKADDDKKTLSQQVADGKYGLIQKELFTGPMRRPGVISYENNSEVPKDNIKNLGGLNKSDIWLAENHLLVLKGGLFPIFEISEYSKPEWPPIDDFAAPKRPVKLSKHPKVPPPFPVQLTDGGPIQILGTNFTRTLNDSFFQSPISSMEGYSPGNEPNFPPPYPYPPHIIPGETPFSGPSYDSPVQRKNISGQQPSPPYQIPINGIIPPFFESLPPGSAVVPPPNITNQFDEDDLSIYYPPPYSFYYPKDNTTQVPPGPLVPGIVLPPPPDFFGILRKLPLPTTKSLETTSPLPTPTKIPKTSTIKTTLTTKSVVPKIYTSDEQRPKNKTINVTILKPVKPTKKPPTVYVYENLIPSKPFADYGPPPSRQPPKVTITTTKIPLRAYFTTSSESDTNFVTRSPQKGHTTKTNHRIRPSSQFYYYEDPITNSISTPYSVDQNRHFFNLSNPYYREVKKYVPAPVIQIQQPPIRPQYYYLPSKTYIPQRAKGRITQQTSPQTNFKTHLIQLQEQIQSYQRPLVQYTPRLVSMQNQKQRFSSPKPVYQYSFEVSNYKEQHDKLQIPVDSQEQNDEVQYNSPPKYSVQIEPAIEITTTEAPIYQNTPPPVYYQRTPQKMYKSNTPRYNYENREKYSSAVTTQPIHDDAYTVTPNPLYQAYYTKQDESIFDEITKKYFTTFGKKLHPSTTPIPRVAVPSPHPEEYSSQDNYPRYVEPSNPRGILINYINQRPNQNIQAEYIPLQQEYSQVPKQVPQFVQSYNSPAFAQRNNNYRQKVPSNNIQAIKAISIPSADAINIGKPGSFISYELPGDDGAHFYFLTPQLTKKRESDRIAYYYTQPSGSSLRQSA